LQQLEKLKQKHASIREVRGMGLMLAMELDNGDRAKAVVSAMLQRGIVINRTHDKVLRFLPPYVIEKNHVDQVISGLDLTLSETEKDSAPVKKQSARRKK
jgi:acetylornithine aminotransferase/acetylornithine/N-succinyldiaminopimelate aminotransferase